jgi:hypothetical protein
MIKRAGLEYAGLMRPSEVGRTLCSETASECESCVSRF